MRAFLQMIGWASSSVCVLLLTISLLSPDASAESGVPNNNFNCGICNCATQNGNMICTNATKPGQCKLNCGCVQDANTGQWYCN